MLCMTTAKKEKKKTIQNQPERDGLRYATSHPLLSKLQYSFLYFTNIHTIQSPRTSQSRGLLHGVILTYEENFTSKEKD